MGDREVLISELHAAAEPLRESCATEVRERVDAAVNEAVQAWENTRAELDALCNRYQHACNLWQQYRDSSAAVKAWVDTQMNSVVNLPPEEAIKQVKVSSGCLNSFPDTNFTCATYSECAINTIAGKNI